MTPVILNHPGLGNSGPDHWQSQWERRRPEILRIQQRDWDTPVCNEWISMLDQYIMRSDPGNVVFVGHSLACTTLAYWFMRYQRTLKGALLVAPSDTEAHTYPPGTSGFTPVPMIRLPFPSIVVGSTDDYYVSVSRATAFAAAWGSRLITLPDAGHINVASGFGPWESGMAFLQELL